MRKFIISAIVFAAASLAGFAQQELQHLNGVDGIEYLYLDAESLAKTGDKDALTIGNLKFSLKDNSKFESAEIATAEELKESKILRKEADKSVKKLRLNEIFSANEDENSIYIYTKPSETDPEKTGVMMIVAYDDDDTMVMLVKGSFKINGINQ